MISLIKKIVIIMIMSVIIYPDYSFATTKKSKTQMHHVKKAKKHITKKTIIKKKSTRKTAKSKIQKPTKTKHTVTKIANTQNVTHSFLPSYLLTTMEKTLVNFVRSTVESIRYTNYKMGGAKIDSSRGIYIVDCSRYVDHILKSIYPRAYTSLTHWSGSEKPTTQDYYQYFRNLSDDSRHWNTVEDVNELRPGDILVFRNKNRYGLETGGHVMIVMDKPLRSGNIFLLRIADSAPSGHSKDTRRPHASGIGIGSMLLKVNPHTARPYAYAWKIGARWETNVSFAMARPMDIS